MRIVLIALAVAMAASGCGVSGPSKSIAGNWRAMSIGHSQFFNLSLTQNGDRVSGAVCSSDSGFLLFDGVPVSGELPAVTFVVPNSGARFAGKFEDERDQIAGDLGLGADHIPLRFVRADDGKCTGAKPLP